MAVDTVVVPLETMMKLGTTKVTAAKLFGWNPFVPVKVPPTPSSDVPAAVPLVSYSP